MRQYVGRVHAGLSDYECMHLWGIDNQPERLNYLYVCGLRPSDSKKDVIDLCREAGLFKFEVQMMEHRDRKASVLLKRRAKPANSPDAFGSADALVHLQETGGMSQDLFTHEASPPATLQ